jgi:hypothetical protein
MDINQCIDKLGLNANTYRLDKSDPPHKFIEWTGSDPQPTQSELKTVWAEIEADIVATQYSRDRATAYASIPDQLDYIYHNGVDAWKENMILPIKNKYPKEIS